VERVSVEHMLQSSEKETLQVLAANIALALAMNEQSLMPAGMY